MFWHVRDLPETDFQLHESTHFYSRGVHLAKHCHGQLKAKFAGEEFPLKRPLTIFFRRVLFQSSIPTNFILHEFFSYAKSFCSRSEMSGVVKEKSNTLHLNPLTPMSDQDRIFSTISIVMRIKTNINLRIIS